MDFLRHVVGGTGVRGDITFAEVCEHRKLFPVEDFLWCVSTHHGKRPKTNSVSGWWCGACGQPYDRRKAEQTAYIADSRQTANEQVGLTADGAPDGECDNMISPLKLVTKLFKKVTGVLNVGGQCKSAGHHGAVGAAQGGTQNLCCQVLAKMCTYKRS